MYFLWFLQKLFKQLPGFLCMKERGFFVLGVLFIGVIFSLGAVSADNVTTQLNITNSPPILILDIPNQSWPENQNLIAAFDLDSYFEDPNGDQITYYVFSPENISVTINSSGVASFYPDADFVGVRYVVFYASDGYDNSTSNNVTLNVGVDSDPPKWSNPAKSLSTIYQNHYVNFSAIWTDDLALKDYTFFISQSSTNSSYVNFTGVQNTSLYEVQVSVAAGSVLSWYFCARDTNLNLNCTDVQNFTVSAQTTSSTSSTTSSGGGTGSGSGTGGSVSEIIRGIFGARDSTKKIMNYTIDPEFFHLSMKQGNSDTRILRISNIGNVNLTFNLILEGLGGMVLLSDKDFSLEFGETKAVTVDFVAQENTPVDEYTGKIFINSSAGEMIVPIVIDVNSREYEFEIDVNLSEKFKRVNPGDDVIGSIFIYNLKDLVFDNVTLYYAIKDLEGNIYDSGEESFLLEQELFLNRTLNLPKDSPVGNYLFYARINHYDFAAIDSDLFVAGSLFDFGAFFRYTFFIILVIFLSALVIILFLRYRYQREKERLLSLYLMLSQMKELIADGKVDKAIDLYVRIKSIYGEPVSKTAMENKESLKQEITKLSSRLKDEVSQASKKTQEEIKEAQKDSDDGKENGNRSSGEEGKEMEDTEKSTLKEEKSGTRKK